MRGIRMIPFWFTLKILSFQIFSKKTIPDVIREVVSSELKLLVGVGVTLWRINMSNLYTPPAPSLIEVCERFLRDYSQATYPAMRDALAREKKRQELVDSLIMGVRNWRNEETAMPYIIRKRSEALDAFDKDGGK